MNTASVGPGRPLEEYPVADLSELPPLPPSSADDTQDRPPASPRPRREIAILQFVDPDAVQTVVPLRFPFRWDGHIIDSITVRRLSVAEVGRITEEMIAARDFDLYRYYEAMAGLPAPVLRGLIEEDGEAMLDAITPFLPRIVQDMAVKAPEHDPASPSKSVSGSGDAMPSRQPDP